MITLATLSTATAQEVFDQVVNHLLTQNEKSLIVRCGCAYRGEGGLKCAAGCLIADEEYKPAFEGDSWKSIVNQYNLSANHLKLIEDLQGIHDEHYPEYWNEYLKVYAVANSLEFNFVK